MSLSAISCEDVPCHPDFRALESIGGIHIDLRYATPDNFVGHDVYGDLDCAWLRREAADALQTAAAWLAVHRPGYRLSVLDALRPQRVQERLWAELQGTPLTLYLANPERGSIHSFGMAVDVTLVDAAGRELDMGTGFDDLSERSHPALEERLLERGELAAAHIDNRLLLREVMAAAGWRGIGSEWWHFDGGDRDAIRAGYLRIL